MDCVSEIQICKTSDPHTRHISKENQKQQFFAVSAAFSKLSSTFYYTFYYEMYRVSELHRVKSTITRHVLCNSKSTTAVNFELHRQQVASHFTEDQKNIFPHQKQIFFHTKKYNFLVVCEV